MHYQTIVALSTLAAAIVLLTYPFVVTHQAQPQETPDRNPDPIIFVHSTGTNQ